MNYKKILGIVFLATMMMSAGVKAQDSCTIVSLPWQETFAGADNTVIPCWKNIRLRSGLNYIYYPRYGTIDGMPCLIMTCINNNYTAKAMPIIGVSDNEIRLSFSAKASTSATDMVLRVGTVDTANFPNHLQDTLYTVNITATNWTEYEFFIPYSAYHNRRIGFQYSSTTRTYLYLTDIRVESTTPCRPPLADGIDNIDTASATLHWLPRCDISTSHEVRLTLADSNDTSLWHQDYTVGDTTAMRINNLTPGTTYYAWIKTLCDTSTTEWVSLGSFTTICTLPYRENTTRTMNHSANTVTPTKPFNANGRQLRISFLYRNPYYDNTSFELGFMSNPNDASTFTPIKRYSSIPSGNAWRDAEEFATAADSIVCVAFREMSGYSYIYVQNVVVEVATQCRRPVAVSVDGITDNIAHMQWTPSPDGMPTTYEARLSLGNSIIGLYTTSDTMLTLTSLNPATTYSVAVRSLCDTTMARAWTPAVSFTTEQSCYPLQSAQVVQAGASAVGIQWSTDNSHYRQTTGVNVTCNEQPNNTPAGTLLQYSNIAWVTGLTPGGSYRVTLTPECDNDSANATLLNFTTDSTALQPLLMAEAVGSESIYLTWLENSGAPDLQYRIHGSDTWTVLPVTSYNLTLNSLEPSTTYDFQIVSYMGGDTLYSSVVSESTLCGPLQIPYSVLLDGTARECWQWWPARANSNQQMVLGTNLVVILEEVDADVSELQLNLRFYGGGRKTFAVGVAEDPTDTSTMVWMHTVTTPQYSSYHDTVLTFNSYTGNGRHFVMKRTSSALIRIEKIDINYYNCRPVDSVWLTDLQSTSAMVEWSNAGNVSGYLVVFQNDTIFMTENSLTLDSLTPTTDYSIRVLSICSNGDTALPSPTLNIHTPCDEYAALPFYENFDNVSTQLPECWTAVTDNYSYHTHWPRVTSSLLLLRSTMNDSIGCIAATPLLPTSQIHVSFRAAFWNTENAQVGLMTDLADTSTFFPLLSLPEENFSFTLYEISTDSLTLNDNSCYLVFRTSDGTLEINDLQINALDHCRTPQYGAISNATTHSVSAIWLSTDADAYLVGYSDGNDTNYVVTDTTTITIGGLTAATRYWLWVSAICGSDTTEAHSLGNIRTDCDLYTLPYFNDFESTPLSSYPQCWESVDNEPQSTNGVNIDLDNYSNHVLYLIYCQAVSPRFIMPDSSLHIAFKASSYFNNPDPDFEFTRGRLQCYTTRVVNEEPQLDSTAILRYDTLLSLTSWDLFSFICNEYQPGDTVAVVFRANSMPQNYRIDDFLIEAYFDTTNINPPPDTVWRTVTVLCDSTMGSVSGGGTYIDSSMVTLSATANDGYRFMQWDDGDTNAVRTLLLVSDTTFTAYFAADTLPTPPPDTVWRTVTVTTNVSGAAEPYGSGVYADSSTVEIGYHLADTAALGGHWQFLGWNDGGTGNPRDILVTSDTAIVALFEWVADSTEGINELSIFSSQFSIYPNPASKTVTVETEQPSTLTLTDATGRVCGQWEVENGKTTLDISPLPAGVYFVRLSTSPTIRKLIIR
jgi:hypothetical protein